MAAAPIILHTNPHRPVDFKESAVAKAIAESGNVNVEKKVDGCQLNMVVSLTDGVWVTDFLSREGKAFNGLADLAKELTGDLRWAKFFNPHKGAALFREEGGFLLQAEIQTLDDTGKPKVCAEISGDLRRMEPIPVNKIRITGFDLIPLTAVTLSDGDYEVFQEVRYGHMVAQVEALKKTFPEIEWCTVMSTPAFSLKHLMEVYEAYRGVGEEGGVAKDPLGFWKRGKKTGQWKVKPDDSCDGTVSGLLWGTPGLSNEGKVIGFTVLTEHGVEVECAGLTEAQKSEYTAKVNEWETREESERHLPMPYAGWACEITYMERLPSGSYRHPNFKQFRGITDPLIKE